MHGMYVKNIYMYINIFIYLFTHTFQLRRQPVAHEGLGDRLNINISTYDPTSIYLIPRYGNMKHRKPSGNLYICVLINLGPHFNFLCYKQY